MVQIIVKNYNHFNKALPNWDTPNGVHVKNKDHYDRLCKENGMISYEQAKDQEKNKVLKSYALSEKGKSIIAAAKQSKDSRGNVKLSDKTIDAMRSIGAVGKKIPNYMQLPSNYGKGGFK